MNTSFRVRLILSFSIVVFLMGAIAAFVGIRLSGLLSFNQAKESLEGDLIAAGEIYADRIREIETILAFTALRPKTVKQALMERDTETLLNALMEVKNASGLDILTIADAGGNVVVRAHNPSVNGDSMLDDEMVGDAITGKHPVSGTSIKARETILHENIFFSGFSSEGGAVRGRNPSNTMPAGDFAIIESVVPIMRDNSVLIGLLIGGKLLYGNTTIIDRIKNIVLADSMNAKKVDAIALYQGDDCIASYSPNGHEMPRLLALNDSGDDMGFQHRTIVHIVHGGEHFIVGHEPIRAFNGGVAGSIAISVFERTVSAWRKRQVAIIVGVIVACIVGSTAAWFFLSKIIARPISDLADRAREVVNGEAKASELHHGCNEVGAVGDALDYFIASKHEQESEIQSIRKEIDQSRRLSTLGRLAAGVAHEINNPLGGIVVFSNLLLENLEPDDPNHSFAEKVVRESNRCKIIVKSLLDFARQSHPQLSPADINRIIGEALINIQNDPKASHITIVDRRDNRLPRIMADTSQIQEVFENIIRNAVDAMGETGTFIIESRTCDCNDGSRGVEILFRDSGPGIPKDIIEHIFDPFFTTKKSGHGTGLGLAVSYGIIERHGGTITACNGVNGGAVFSIRLPVGEKSA